MTNTAQKTITLFNHSKHLLTVLLIPVILSLSACGKSDTELCIEEQSALWNNQGKTKADNQAYWSAVAQCRADHP